MEPPRRVDGIGQRRISHPSKVRRVRSPRHCPVTEDQQSKPKPNDDHDPLRNVETPHWNEVSHGPWPHAGPGPVDSSESNGPPLRLTRLFASPSHVKWRSGRDVKFPDRRRHPSSRMRTAGSSFQMPPDLTRARSGCTRRASCSDFDDRVDRQPFARRSQR